MTTKFPLCAVMMELTSTLARQGRSLRLHWAPREQNVEADELSNEKWHRFDPSKRIDVEPLLANMKLFNRIVKYGRGLYAEIEESKRARKPTKDRGSSPKRKRALKEKAPW